MDKKYLAAGAEKMRCVAKLLLQWAEDMEKSLPPEDVTEAPEPVAAESVTAEPPEEKPAPTYEEVMEFLKEKCVAGYGPQVQALIASFGAVKLSGVPPEMYAAVMEAASAIGVTDACAGGDVHAG